MWIRLPKQNASKTASPSPIRSWSGRLKVLAVVGCVVWGIGLWNRNSRSQEFKQTALDSKVAAGAFPEGASQPLELSSANLSGSNLRSADLRSADLRGVDLSNSSMSLADPSNGNSGGADLGDERPQAPIPAPPPVREIATQILHRTLLESVWGAPTLCEVRQSIQFADKKRSSFGKYVRGGKGLGKMRMTLQVPAGDQMNSLLQVSDGELLTTMVSVGDQITMTQIDLGKIRERLTITQETIQDPVIAMYLAFGGQAEVLRTICQKYDWTKVTEGQLGTRKVWWIRGVVTTQPIGPVAEATIDQRLFQKPYDSVIPPNVKLAIGHTESEAPFWLYQVETWNDGDVNGRGKAYVLTEWDSPVRLSVQQMTPDLFQLGADHSASDVREETKLYLPPPQKPATMR